jgi:hypothetical protein
MANQAGGRRCPLIFYEKPFLCIFLFWFMAGLDAPLTDFWHYVAEPPTEKKKPPASRTRLMSHYWASPPSLRELLSKDAIERGKNLKPTRRPGLLTPQEELELARRGKAGDIRARDETLPAIGGWSNGNAVMCRWPTRFRWEWPGFKKHGTTGIRSGKCGSVRLRRRPLNAQFRIL